MSANIAKDKLVYNLSKAALADQKNLHPITAQIYITDYCNNKCPYCTYARYMNRNNEYMPLESFKEYVAILTGFGVKGIIISGGGEPTLHPEFEAIAEHLETNNIPYGINTNFNVFKAIKPNYLKISLDGYNRESYLKARGVDKYDTVIRNIKEYLLYKHGTKAKTSVGLQTVVTSAEDVVKFYEAHKELDVDYYSLRPVESTQGKYYKENSEQEVNEIKQALAELSALDKRICVNYKWNYLDRKFEKCHAAAFQICVNHKGDVSFCCHKPYEIVGHITDRDILQKKAAYKTDMNMCDTPCRLTGPCQCIYELEQDIVNPEFI